MPSDTVKVTIIRDDAHAALVQYYEGDVLARKIVPTVYVVNGEIDRDNLDMGIEAPGIPWWELMDVSNLENLPQRFQEVMHQIGVWEIEDATPMKVYEALQKTLGINASLILKKARERSFDNG